MTSPDPNPDPQPEPERPDRPDDEQPAAKSDEQPTPAASSADATPSADATDPQTPQPEYADRVFRSSAGIAGGVLLLGLSLWIGGDALVRGDGRTPWLALAGLLFLVPLIVAYTVRPAVFVNQTRLRVRNPFRTITLPLASVEALRSGYSSEVFASDGHKYQLWAIPVSLRARKKAARRQVRDSVEDPSGRTSPLFTGRNLGPTRAPSDQALDDLRELAERHAADPGAQGEPSVRWAYEILAPSVAGAVLLAVLLLIG
ncbi:PH domain-containing protein [Streptomyces cavernicola]|uniref:PH domain-containing protein n=1 Tax=Streptomyces cavernicola TaxID=3043613 RepID=A0ABT6SLT7_9ACTN|nr:PH domain-containing protein [Streptomyces sp. B-S-A6]MDI3409049.1 PH domain-containing protein [Streptomyces sp. B-S-A6]